MDWQEKSEEIRLEDTRLVLSLTYDSFTDINKNAFIVSEDGLYFIINQEMDIISNKFKSILKFGDTIIASKDSYYTCILKINDKGQYCEDGYIESPEIIGNAILIYGYYGNRAIVSKYGDLLLPPIYKAIKFISEEGNYYRISANLEGRYLNIMIDKKTLKPNYVDMIQSDEVGVYYRAKFIDTEGPRELKSLSHYTMLHKKYNLKYGLYRVSSLVTEQIYDSISSTMGLKQLGLLSVKDGNKQGIIDYYGNEIVGLTRCEELVPTALSGYFLALSIGKVQVYIYDEKRYSSMVFNCYTFLNNSPIVMLGNRNKNRDEIDWYYLTNTGGISKDLKSFNIRRSDTDNTFKADIYQKTYEIDNNFKIIRLLG